MTAHDDGEETGFAPDDDDDEQTPVVDDEAPADAFLNPRESEAGPLVSGRHPSGAARPPQAPSASGRQRSEEPAAQGIDTASFESPPRASGGNPSGAGAPPTGPRALSDAVRPVAPEEITTGTVIDEKYLVSVKLGQGGMGTVYRARHKLLQKDVALKVISPHMAQDPSFKARFFREAKVAMEFVHRHAIPLRDFGVTATGLFYMTMDYSSGTPLRQIVEQGGPLDSTRAARIVYQMLEALGEAHRHKIIHRDLKPDNVIVETDRDGSDFVKVLDFGLAKIATGEEDGSSPSLSSSDGGAILGTPAYMAPEQACGEEVDNRADIYACAIVLYQLLTGQLPFKAPTTRQMILKQVTSTPPPFKDVRPDIAVPDGLEAVVMKGLAKERAERYQSAEEFADALEPFIGRRRRTSADSLGPGAIRVATEVAVGATIDRYKILEKIAEGGFGAVWRAEHVLMNRSCAFKVMKPGLSDDREFASRFQREAQVASRFKHPNAVEVYDFGRVGTQLFMAMELVEGKPLTKRLKGEGAPLGLRDAVEIVCQVLDCLEAAHKGGIVHRDLKPDNIMLNDVGGWPNQVKVLDFGIAKIQDPPGATPSATTQAGSFFGTPQYSSPEQCKGESSTLDGRSDLYTVGVILFELLTGKLPYESETMAGFLAAHIISPPRGLKDAKPDAGVPDAVDAVVRRALEKPRDKRFQTAREFSDALKRAASIHPVFEVGDGGVRLAGEGTAPPPAPPRSRPLTVALACALLVLLGLLGYALLGLEGDRRHGRLTIHATPPGESSVTLVRVKNGEERALRTGADGSLVVPGLILGRYRLAVFREGFERETREIELKGGALDLEVPLPPDLRLACGQAEKLSESAREEALAAGAGEMAQDALRAADGLTETARSLEKANDFAGAKARWEKARDAYKAAVDAAQQAAVARESVTVLEGKVGDARDAAEQAGAEELAGETYQRASAEQTLAKTAVQQKDFAAALKYFENALALFQEAGTTAFVELDAELERARKETEAARTAAQAAGVAEKAPAAWKAAEDREHEAAALAATDRRAALTKFRDALRLMTEAKGGVEESARFAQKLDLAMKSAEREALALQAARQAAELAQAPARAKAIFAEADRLSEAAASAERVAELALRDAGVDGVEPEARAAVLESLSLAARKNGEARQAFDAAARAARQDALRSRIEEGRAAATRRKHELEIAESALHDKSGFAGAARKAADADATFAEAEGKATLVLSGLGSEDDARHAIQGYSQAEMLYRTALALLPPETGAGPRTSTAASTSEVSGPLASLKRLLDDWKRAYEAKDVDAFSVCFGEWEGERKDAFEAQFADGTKSFKVSCEAPALFSSAAASARVAVTVTDDRGEHPPTRMRVLFRRVGGAWKIDQLKPDKGS